MLSGLSRRRILLLVVLTCVLLITLDKRGNPIIDQIRSVFARVVQPIDTATEAITLPLERAWDGISHYDDVQQQNEALWDQIQHMKGNDVEAKSAILEYRELLKLNQLTSKFQYDTAPAQVVGASPSNFQNTVEINVGSLRGVQVGMPVTDGAGLIGRITKVFAERSIVLLITDPEYAVEAQVLSTPGGAATTTTTATEDTTLSGIPVSDLTSSTTSTSSTTTTTTQVLPPELTPITDPAQSSTTGPGTGSTTIPSAATTTSTILEVVRETGTLEGQGAAKPMILRFVDTTSSVTSVKIGAIVDTAGGNNSLAPQGIPIGIISRIERQTGSSSALVEVTPNASLQRLNFVAVVLYSPNQDAVGK